MGAERRCSITGWRTRATRAPPAFHPSRARLHPVSVARSSAARMSSSSVGSPKPVYSYPSCGRVRALHAILRPRIPPNRPQDAQNGRESGFPGFRSTTLDGCHPVGQGPIHGRILRPAPVTAKFPGWRSGEGSTSAGSSATTGLRSAVAPATEFGGWSTSPPAARVAGRKRRVRGGAAPRQPRSGTHGVWPQRVRWLVSHNHADSRVICMTGSRGRPGLFTTSTKACPSSILCRTSEPRGCECAALQRKTPARLMVPLHPRWLGVDCNPVRPPTLGTQGH